MFWSAPYSAFVTGSDQRSLTTVQSVVYEHQYWARLPLVSARCASGLVDVVRDGMGCSLLPLLRPVLVRDHPHPRKLGRWVCRRARLPVSPAPPGEAGFER